LVNELNYEQRKDTMFGWHLLAAFNSEHFIIEAIKLVGVLLLVVVTINGLDSLAKRAWHRLAGVGKVPPGGG
jgi:hypothetical protein